MRILILYQHNENLTDRQDELDTITQVNEVSICLNQLGYQVQKAPCSSVSHIEEAINRIKPDVVFNMVESLYGSDKNMYLAPALLDALHVPYTGNSAESIFLSSDKNLVKQRLKQHGIKVPETAKSDSDELFIVKSTTEHASFGIDSNSVVKGFAAAEKLIRHKKNIYGGEWLAETYIEGREINVAIIGNSKTGKILVLPPAEIIFQDFETTTPKIVDYAAKWDEDSFAYHNTPRQFISDSSEFIAIAKQCFLSLNLNGYARVDFRQNNAGDIYVIDINPNPCLSLDAGFIAAAEQFGLRQQDIIKQLIEIALYETNINQPATI